MLQVKNLTITHRKDLRVILKDFKVALNEGDKAVIIGEEGNGKSALLQAVVRPEALSQWAEISGAIHSPGERIGSLAQESPSAWNGTKEITSGIWSYAWPRALPGP